MGWCCARTSAPTTTAAAISAPGRTAAIRSIASRSRTSPRGDEAGAGEPARGPPLARSLEEPWYVDGAVKRLGATGLAIVALSGLACPNTGRRSECISPAAGRPVEWREYGGDSGGQRFSPLAAVTRDNVRCPEPA